MPEIPDADFEEELRLLEIQQLTSSLTHQARHGEHGQGDAMWPRQMWADYVARSREMLAQKNPSQKDLQKFDSAVHTATQLVKFSD